MKSMLAALVLALHLFPANAAENVKDLAINSPKDALLLIGKDHFGTVSFEQLMADILGDVVYKQKQKYATGYVAVESQNDHGHYGSLDFEFKPPYDFTMAEAEAHLSSIEGVKTSNYDGIVTYSWQSHGFKCSLDVKVADDEDGEAIFQFLVHFAKAPE